MSKNALVIYNGNTLDGQASAFSIYSKLRDSVEYVAVDYGKLSVFDHITEGSKIRVLYVLALHLTGRDIERLTAYCDTLVYIDSHFMIVPESVTDKVSVYSIEGRSACAATWGYFMPETKIPEILQYIEDVELGRLELRNSIYVCAGLRYKLLNSSNNSFLQNLNDFVQPSIPDLAMDGMHTQQMFKTVGHFLANNCGHISCGKYSVGVVNAPKLFSSSVCLNILSISHCDFVLLYEDCRFSSYVYRSWTVACPEGSDLTADKIAGIFEGFGSRRFSGFVSSPQLDEIAICAEIERKLKL